MVDMDSSLWKARQGESNYAHGPPNDNNLLEWAVENISSAGICDYNCLGARLDLSRLRRHCPAVDKIKIPAR